MTKIRNISIRKLFEAFIIPNTIKLVITYKNKELNLAIPKPRTENLKKCFAYQGAKIWSSEILNLSRPLTTSYGLHSFKYATAKFWNSLPNNIRTIATLDKFKRTIRQHNFN